MVTISENLRKLILKSYTLKNNTNIFSAHDGVNIEVYKSLILNKKVLRKKLFPNVSENKIILTHSGSISRGGSEILFENYRKYNNLHIVMIGIKKEDFVNFPFLRKYQYSNDFTFINWLEQKKIAKYQVASDILIYLTSKQSAISSVTSPLKIFEYMATKNYFISSLTKSISEVLNDKNAYNYLIDDKKSFLKTMDKLFEDIKNNDQSRPLRAFEDVENNYTWNKRSSKIIKNISELI